MSFCAPEIESLHYAVILAILDTPKETWPKMVEKLNITKEQLFDSYDFLDREDYLSGMNFARGKGNKILVPFFDNAAATQKGLDFMARMEKQPKSATPKDPDHSELPSIFVSYNQKSSGGFVDALEETLCGKANLRRDKKDIGAWDGITAFMDTIRNQDFAVLFISEGYLKSAACLYEVMQLMKDVNWNSKTMYVVMDDANIYKVDGRATYTAYWVQQCKSLEEGIRALPPAAAVELSNELRKYELIRNEIGNFLARVADTNNPPLYAAIDKIGERVSASSKSSDTAAKEKSNLRPDAERMLFAACEGDGIIIAIQSLSSYDITIANQAFVKCSSNRDIALWKSVLGNLEVEGLIEAMNYKKEIYRVTQEGYEYVEAHSEHQM